MLGKPQSTREVGKDGGSDLRVCAEHCSVIYTLIKKLAEQLTF